MAKVERNSIVLITGYDEDKDKLQTKRYWTPGYTPLRDMYDAIDLLERITAEDIHPREALDAQADFIANVAYKGQFSADELIDGLHITNAVEEMERQILFISQGRQSDETKKFLERKA